MLTLVGLAFATLVSEDLTCVTAGTLVAEGRLHPLPAIAACALGIAAGDCGLWLVGRSGGCLARFFWRSPKSARSAPLVAWLRRHSGAAIFSSRFLPGTRLPLYLTAGAIGVPGATFAAWSVLAAAIWTPALVLLSAGLGSGANILHVRGELASVGRFVAAVGAIPLIALIRAVAVPSLRLQMAARLARWRRWEFWPMWLFYAPVAAWVAWLAVRYRGFSTITASNPAIPEGGLVGESKYDILQRLPAAWVIPAIRVAAGDGSRVDGLRTRIEHEGWAFPLILKPDVGQRGLGVKRIQSWSQAERYLDTVRGAVLAQPYHDGPFEAGVFYYRFPHWSRGRLLSITDKVFPDLIGDGRSTLEELIWRHPRFRMQARTFLMRHEGASTRVLAEGECLRLAIAGNHAQGTLFRDGTHLMTPELEARIDEIARHRPGFFIGRFDIRYRSVDGFKSGHDLAIVELNGATAESTNIYDPDRSLWSAYRVLFRQWSLVFAIGAANRREGAPVSSFGRLVQLARMHLMARPVLQISD